MIKRPGQPKKVMALGGPGEMGTELFEQHIRTKGNIFKNIILPTLHGAYYDDRLKKQESHSFQS